MRKLGTCQFLYSAILLKDKIPDVNAFPFSLPIIKNFKQLDFHQNVTFLTGENGSGKSTLLESIALAMGFNAEGGTKNFNFSTHSSHSELWRYMRLSRGLPPKDGFFLRAESFYNFATEIHKLDEAPSLSPPIINSYGGVPLHKRSHGEAFFSLFMHRFVDNGLYILDEPEAALSPTKQMAMLSRMDQLVKRGAQFIIATHSPIILAYPRAKILSLDTHGVQEICYEDTDHFTLYKYFLNNYKAMLNQLTKEKINEDTHL